MKMEVILPGMEGAQMIKSDISGMFGLSAASTAKFLSPPPGAANTPVSDVTGNKKALQDIKLTVAKHMSFDYILEGYPPGYF